MKTTIINIDPDDVYGEAIKGTGILMRRGVVEAFLTETVCGLSADITNSKYWIRSAVLWRSIGRAQMKYARRLSNWHKNCDDYT